MMGRSSGISNSCSLSALLTTTVSRESPATAPLTPNRTSAPRSEASNERSRSVRLRFASVRASTRCTVPSTGTWSSIRSCTVTVSCSVSTLLEANPMCSPPSSSL